MQICEGFGFTMFHSKTESLGVFRRILKLPSVLISKSNSFKNLDCWKFPTSCLNSAVAKDAPAFTCLCEAANAPSELKTTMTAKANEASWIVKQRDHFADCREIRRDINAPNEVENTVFSYIIALMEKEQVPNELTAKVIDIIFSALNLKHIDRTTVNSSTTLAKGGLNLDSIDILELIVNFEHTFGIKLNESESYAEHFKDIGSIVSFIQSKKTR
ncbi:MAG: acyl carrier protein [Proteobacteria bacterium]|nr:MAG: acyl carrier protein [Pseudomonadota bacterium]